MRTVLARYERTGILLDVTGSPTKNGKMRYVFTIQTVNPSTGQPEVVEATSFLAQHAALAALKGQQVTASIEQSQNGQYTNTDLQDIQAGAPIGSGMVTGAVPVGAASAPIQNVLPVGVSPAPVRDFDAEALGKIRHGQFQSAAALVGVLIAAGEVDAADDAAILGKIIQYAEAGVYYTNTGLSIAESVSAAPVVESTPEIPATPQEVAQSLPAGTVQVGSAGLPWGAQA